MMEHTESGELLYSSLGSHPGLGKIVTEFVEEMPERILDLRQATDATDWESLKRLAHQLKGAGGSYGFDELTSGARQLESAVDLGQESETQRAVEHLIDLCSRARAGAPR